MKALLRNNTGAFCPKRIGFYLFGTTAVIGFFIGGNEYLTAAFLAAAVGKSFMIHNEQ